MLTIRRSLAISTTFAALTAGLVGCAIFPVDSGASAPALSAPTLSRSERLRADVDRLAGVIGERNIKHSCALAGAEDFLAASLARAGYAVHWQTYMCAGVPVSNLIAELPGTQTPDEIVLVGAHYDTVDHHEAHTPGADDNASGCAGVLELARAFAGEPQGRTVRFVLFVNEEPPYFWTDEMGSLVYARAAKAFGDDIRAMISLEMIGYFSDTAGSQDYPPGIGLVMPDAGNFIAFVSFAADASLVEHCVAAFRETTTFPAAGAALPTLIPRIGSGDHWSFWKQGYPSLMVTDTAIHRNRNYHKAGDTADKLNFDAMAQVVDGVEGVVRSLANDTKPSAPALPD